jgi:hypothetical protein
MGKTKKKATGANEVPKPPPLRQVATRLTEEQDDELANLAALASTPLYTVTKSDVLRRAIDLGLVQVRAEIEGKSGGKRKAGR